MRRIIWALPVGAAVAILFVWVWIGTAPETNVVRSPAPSRADEGAPAPPAVGRRPLVDRPDNRRHDRNPLLDVRALRQLCGRPWEAAFSRECSTALERRYGETVPELNTGFFRPVMLGEPVTWAQVFDDAAATLAAVTQALARPECSVPEGRIRIDLREKCAADQMAKLAILRDECARSLRRHDSLERRQRWWEVDLAAANREVGQARAARTRQPGADLAAANREVGQAEYHRRLEQMDEDWFGRMWRLDECRAVPEDALKALGPFAPAFGLRQFGNEQADLMKAAARLGSDWALSSVLWWTNGLFGVAEDQFDAVARERPVLAELLRMRRAAGVERIKHAVVSFRLGEALGVPVHSEGVLAFTGEVGSDEHRAAWQLAAPRLMELGWTLVVADPEGSATRRFETPADLWGDEERIEWVLEGRVTLVPGPDKRLR